MIILTVIAFIVIFSILILIHEIGHFTMARKAGIKVEEFGIGLPPKAKKLYKDKKGTEYTLNWIPFGGFVRMYGEDSFDKKILKDPKSFASKSIWQRTQVIVAGVVMNFLLAWILISIGFTFGMKPFLVNQNDLNTGIENGMITVDNALLVHSIKDNSPINKININTGDFIIRINNKDVPSAENLSSVLLPNQLTTLTTIKDGKEATYEVTTDTNGKLGFEISDQILIKNVKGVKLPFYIAPIEAGKEVVRLSVLTVKMLGDVIVSLVAKFTVPAGVAGPVGIAKMTHYFVQQGFMALLQFTALISISLGVINIMPFPALDGGRFLFIIFEVITRKKPNAKMEAVIHTIGFSLLMVLIFVITWNDIVNLFS